MMISSESSWLFSFKSLSLISLAVSITISSTISLSQTSPETTSIQNQNLNLNQKQQDLNYGESNYLNLADRTRRHATLSSQQLVIQPGPSLIEINSTSDSATLLASNNNNNYLLQQQQQQQNSRFRVNVSNVCERNYMKVTVRLNRPFYGLIHAKDKRKKAPCFVEGTGEQSYTLDVSFTLIPSDVAYCGIVAHQLASSPSSSSSSSSSGSGSNNRLTTGIQEQTVVVPTTSSINQSILALGSHQQQQQQQQETLSLALVVRLHKTIEFSDDRYFLLSCPNRCSRSDCSSASSSSPLDSSLVTSHETRKGFVTSDSILSPVFKSQSIGSSSIINTDEQKQQQLNNQLRHPPIITAATTTTASERCDMMIDLKFQWLVKLCWILIGLIALMFCTIFYLCVASDSSKSSTRKFSGSSHRDQRSEPKHQVVQGRKSHSTNGGGGGGDQSTSYQPTKSSSSGLDTTESLNTTELGWSTSGCSMLEQQQQQQPASQLPATNHHLDKLRENNQYLANKQHLLLADFLAAKNAIEEYEQQQQQQQQHHRPTILGRSEDSDFNRRQLYQNHILRRRSIGGSAAFLNDSNYVQNGTDTLPANGSNHHHHNHNHHHHQRSDHVSSATLTTGNRKLDQRHKQKSKSQTTIYYEQSQDPFKAIPFNIGTYLGEPNQQQQQQQHSTKTSDENQLTDNRPFQMDIIQHQHRHEQQSGMNGAMIHDAQVGAWSEFEPQSLPMPLATSGNKFHVINNNNNNSFAPDNDDQRHQQVWQQPTLSDETSMSFGAGGGGAQSTSQFDPQNQSHQLIDLIQNKHREQMAQANRTAASLGFSHHNNTTLSVHNSNSASGNSNHPSSGKHYPPPRPILSRGQQSHRQTTDGLNNGRTEQQQQQQWR